MRETIGAIFSIFLIGGLSPAVAANNCKAQFSCIHDLTTNDDEIHVKNTCSHPVTVEWIVNDNAGQKSVYETQQIAPGYDESRLCMASMNCSKMLGWKIQGC